MECIKCGSANLAKDGKSKDGTKQRYRCKDCGRRFTEEVGYIIFQETNLYMFCPICGGQDFRKKGFTKAGNRSYYCNYCKHKFTPDGRIRGSKRIPIEDKKLIVYFRRARVSITDLSKHFHYSIPTIRQFLKERGISTDNLARYRKNEVKE